MALARNGTQKPGTQNGKPAIVGLGQDDVAPEDGLVKLDVTLPDGQRKDIQVEYTTPMLDLLVCLAAKSRLNPSGLALQLVAEDTGKPLAYKANQTIGSLGGRVVRIVSKDDLAAKSKNKPSKQDKPFEMTQRFTVNLPRGQKTVLRISPQMALGELMNLVCEDKGLDPRRHVLQIPGKPGEVVDLNASIQQMGIHEMNLITVGLQNNAVSLPDLSKPVPKDDKVSFSTPSPTKTAEPKKKRSFLSFLSKKDKKYKASETNMETSSSGSQKSNSAPAQKPRTPPPTRRNPEPDNRPKSMFIPSTKPVDEDIGNNNSENAHTLVAPARKKRRAPAPPVPAQVQIKVQEIPADNASAPVPQSQHNSTPQVQNSGLPVQHSSRSDALNRLHSRNSSDSSGYHELTLSGCESPEAAHLNGTKFKTSIDTTSIESTEMASNDVAAHESPSKISTIVELHEKSEATSITSTSPPLNTGTLPSMKKRKAPAPPAPPVPAPSVPKVTPTEPQTTPTEPKTTPTEPQTTPTEPQTTLPQVTVSQTNSQVTATVSQTTPTNPQTTLPPPAPSSPEDTRTDESLSQEANMVVDVADNPITHQESVEIEEEIVSSLHHQEEQAFNSATTEDQADSSSLSSSVTSAQATFDDILNGIQFEEEKPTLIKVNNKYDENDDDEKIEQVQPYNERPCAFIPPPPPTEPPPDNFEVDERLIETSYEPILIDKETEVNEDNTSLATSSAKSSPGHARKFSITSLGSVDTIEDISLDFEQTIQFAEETILTSSYVEEGNSGYKNEMAQFVERMSKLALENPHLSEVTSPEDSISLSVHGSDTNSETGSVIQHNRTDSKDSRSESESGSLSRKLGKKVHAKEVESPVCEEVPFNGGLSHSYGGGSQEIAVCEEMTVLPETVPPPPEFDDDGIIEKVIDSVNINSDTVNRNFDRNEKDSDSESDSSSDVVDDLTTDRNVTSYPSDNFVDTSVGKYSNERENVNEEDEEEYYSETVEELIIPLGPNGYDFSAAVKVDETSKEKPPEPSTKEAVTGVFRAVPLSIAPFSYGLTSAIDAQLNQPTPTTPAPKEEFVLTSEDLSSVCFLPPKLLKAKPQPDTQSTVHVSSTSLTIDQNKKESSVLKAGASDLPASRPVSQIKSSLKVKTYPLSSSSTAVYSAWSDTANSSTNLSTNSTGYSTSRSDTRPVDNDPSSSDPLATRSTPRLLMNSQPSNHSQFRSSQLMTTPVDIDVVDSAASSDSGDTLKSHDTLKAQYLALQAQSLQWKQQLALNQNLLTTQIVDNVQPTSLPVNKGELNSLASPPPPPAPVKVKSKSSSVKQRPKYEPEVDPREQLMISIRSFKGREGLRTVPVKNTKWV
ncbi:mucin-2-like isoform X2 [Physella acuta]|nr:mucin-2-like isoform X2 [Physella acuta]XP_059171514.1 mucin-2-like isoform X2 [Physella acuta]